MLREEDKAPQVNTRAPGLPTDGPDHTTRPKGHHSGQGWNSRPITSNWCNPQVLLGCKSSTQKSRPLESGHRRRAVWIAIGHSYKLGQKMNLNFSAN